MSDESKKEDSSWRFWRKIMILGFVMMAAGAILLAIEYATYGGIFI